MHKSKNRGKELKLGEVEQVQVVSIKGPYYGCAKDWGRYGNKKDRQ